MKHKQKELERIAGEIDQLAGKYNDPSLKEVAALLRKSLTSGKQQSNEQSETNEDDTGGNQPPPSKERP